VIVEFAAFPCHWQKGSERSAASKLIGWDIDIKSEEEKRCEMKSKYRLTAPTTPLTAAGVGPKTIEKIEVRASLRSNSLGYDAGTAHGNSRYRRKMVDKSTRRCNFMKVARLCPLQKARPKLAK
jgi:hypothetical protein